MESVLQITKALADRQRIRILMLLKGRELCVCQIISVFDLAPSTISKHLSILSSAGLVEHRKDGRWAYYRLPSGSGDPMIRSSLQWVVESLRRDGVIEEDARKISKILKYDPEILCQQMRNG
ncbi:MAG: metalloregulator ArsR/SmtB family transcription factor [Candidatus Krumholzibacteria bacterium]|nr:metalloregulator ArsR/SmtB family transcription factor [Candidatus Krumholzibacteria bacterium]